MPGTCVEAKCIAKRRKKIKFNDIRRLKIEKNHQKH